MQQNNPKRFELTYEVENYEGKNIGERERERKVRVIKERKREEYEIAKN